MYYCTSTIVHKSMQKHPKIGIIGAGFTGLTAGLRLSQKGSEVVIFEMQDRPGGLASGFKSNKWKWRLEKYYHHLFTSDRIIRNIAKEVGQEIVYKKATTSTYLNGKIFRLDSALQLLKFSPLSFVDRLRTGIALLYLKATPFWKTLEKQTAQKFLKKSMGNLSWSLLWKPLFKGKFGGFGGDIPASWFWARIKKRSSSLGYPKGGFGSFAEKFISCIKKNGGEIIYQREVKQIIKKGKNIIVETNNGTFKFEQVICTLPTPAFINITKGLSESYVKILLPLKFMGMVNLVLSLKKQYFPDGTYWLNIADKTFPFLGVVEHTNFADKGNYNGETILYIGNYLPHGHSYFDKSAKELLEIFTPYLQKISSDFNKSHVNNLWVFKTPYAQPIFSLNYSKKIPGYATSIKGLFLANIQQVYPWDRGTNYAVEMGEKIAKLVDQDTFVHN